MRNLKTIRKSLCQKVVVAAAMTLVKKRVTNKYFEKLDFKPKPLLYSALASPGPQLRSQLAYKSWLSASSPDSLSCNTQNRAFSENGSCIQTLDIVLTA